MKRNPLLFLIPTIACLCWLPLAVKLAQTQEREITARSRISASTLAIAGQYYALLIGVSDYADPRVNGLDYPLRDVARIKQVLTTHYSFAAANVTTLADPTREQILSELQRLTRLKAEDHLLIFYAGHGVWNEVNQQGYWLPRDARKDVRASWISNSDLRDAIVEIPVRHTLLISDACFSGSLFVMREAFTRDPALDEVDRLRSRTAMTSGALTTVPDRSVFVQYLLDRLERNAAPYLFAQELFAQLRQPVINNSKRQADGTIPTPRYGVIHETKDEGGDFIFLRKAATAAVSPSPATTPNVEPSELQLQLWYVANGEDKISWYEKYLQQYPNGLFADSARNRIAKLKVSAMTPSNKIEEVQATIETEPMPHAGDAAVDPAIWVNAENPAMSLIIGTDKAGGIAVYDLDGKQLQYLPDGLMANVDLRNDFPLGGQKVVLVTASNLKDNSIAMYRLNPATRQLENVAARIVKPDIAGYGMCMYRSAKTGKFYYFVSGKSGVVEQYELFNNADGKVDAKKVRAVRVYTPVQGCVADDQLGHLYISDQSVGIWKYGAEPDSSTQRTQVGKVGDGNLFANVEGVTIAYGLNGTGHLIVSSQGNFSYVVYKREGNNEFVKTFRIGDGAVDGAEETAGIDITTHPLGHKFPHGMLVVQDGYNDKGSRNQNFKLVPLQSIDLRTTGNVTQFTPPQTRTGEMVKNGFGMEFTYIPSGKFQMGSTEADIRRIVSSARKIDNQANANSY